jgi:hypothetical protein
MLSQKLGRWKENITYVTPSYNPHRVTNPFTTVTDKLSLILCAVRNEENTAMFPSFIIYRFIPDPLLCHVGNLRYLGLAIGQRLTKSVLVCGINCHPPSAVLASAVLSCLSVTLCTKTPTSLGIFSTSSRTDSTYCEDYCPLGCGAIESCTYLPVFWEKVLPCSSKTEGELSLSMRLLPHVI